MVQGWRAMRPSERGKIELMGGRPCTPAAPAGLPGPDGDLELADCERLGNVALGVGSKEAGVQVGFIVEKRRVIDGQRVRRAASQVLDHEGELMPTRRNVSRRSSPVVIRPTSLGSESMPRWLFTRKSPRVGRVGLGLVGPRGCWRRCSLQ